MNTRDLALATIGKGVKKKTTKSNMDSLGSIKAWSGFDNGEDRINSIKGKMELAYELAKVSGMDQEQRSKKNGN